MGKEEFEGKQQAVMYQHSQPDISGKEESPLYGWPEPVYQRVTSTNSHGKVGRKKPTAP